MRLAGIDIGTLTCRLLIANVTTQGKLETLFSDRKILRLGEGVDQDKRLNPKAMARVVETIQDWRNKIDEYGVDRAISVATSAVRDAKNQDEFLSRIKNEVGMDVEVIAGEQEARLTLLGIRSGLKPGITDVLAVDIGGGSTEFILSCEGQHPQVVSVDMGVVRVFERFLHSDPPTTQEKHEAQQWTTRLIQETIVKLGTLDGVAFVGTAGTITTLSAMAQGLTTYEPERIHNSVLRLATIQDLEHDLFHRTHVRRRDISGLEHGREDVILAGVLILRCIMECCGYDQCLVSEYGLREGVLINLAQRPPAS